MKIGDVIATVLFWLIFGPAGLGVGAVFIFGGLHGINASHPEGWFSVAIGGAFVLAVGFGIWHSFRSLKKKRNGNAA